MQKYKKTISFLILGFLKTLRHDILIERYRQTFLTNSNNPVLGAKPKHWNFC